MSSNKNISRRIKKEILNNDCDYDTLYNNFLAWSYCNGIVWEGLKRRRISEAKLFLENDYSGNC